MRLALGSLRQADLCIACQNLRSLNRSHNWILSCILSGRSQEHIGIPGCVLGANSSVGKTSQTRTPRMEQRVRGL